MDIELPDGRTAEFPDNMPMDQINTVLAKQFPAPASAPQIPGGITGAIANFGRGARMAIPGGDRLVAAAQAIPHAFGLGGEGYSENLARSRAADQALESSGSTAGALGQAAGSLVAGAPATVIAPEALGAGILGKAATAAAQGSLLGGAQGASESPDLTDIPATLASTGRGAVMGGALGGGLGLGAAAIGKIPIFPQAKQLGDQYTRDILNAGDIPGSNNSPRTLQAARDSILEARNGVADRNTFVPDQVLHSEAQDALADQVTPNPAVQKMVDAIPKEGIPGGDYLQLRSEATKKSRSSQFTDPDTSMAFGRIRDALDSAMERSIAVSNPADSGVLPRLNKSYGNLQDVEKASAKLGPGGNDSILDPARMQSVLSSGNRASSYAEERTPLASLTREAMTNIKPAPPSNQLIDALMSQHIGGHAARALAGGLTGTQIGGVPGAVIGALGGAALPAATAGIQAGRGAIGNMSMFAGPQLSIYGMPPNMFLRNALVNQLSSGNSDAP
jgi:hypothetical protein